jgi:hypothetical protein
MSEPGQKGASNERSLLRDLGPDAERRPARPRPVHPSEPGFVGEHDPQPTAAPLGGPPCSPYGAWKAVFLKYFWASTSCFG